MSYDLMVFEPSRAPRDRAAFMEWYDRQTTWSEPHGYDDPSATSPRLRAWYEVMIADFADMNGDLPDSAYDDPTITDYCIGRDVIYAGFRWSRAEEAYRAVRDRAEKHGVGFYDVSGNGEIWLPADAGPHGY